MAIAIPHFKTYPRNFSVSILSLNSKDSHDKFRKI